MDPFEYQLFLIILYVNRENSRVGGMTVLSEIKNHAGSYADNLIRQEA
jgi:hypothetical protein